MKEVSDKVNSYENISIDFKYVLENTSENIKQETRGDVVLQGDKYKLNILGVTRLFDGKTLYNISPEDEEVTVSTKKDDDDEEILFPELIHDSFVELEGHIIRGNQNSNTIGLAFVVPH